MFAKLFFAAIALGAFLVNADPTPTVPGEYMRFTLLRITNGL